MRDRSLRDSEVKRTVESHEDALQDIMAEIEDLKKNLVDISKRLDELEEEWEA